jgi:quercetin dioxygenase-like cupin family protein
MANTTTNITMVDNQSGQSISVVGDTYKVIISGKETNNNYAVIDMLVPPGGGPGPHAHAGFQELFYVLDGEVEFKNEAGKYTATKGSLINIPLGGAVHGFKNISNTTAHLLCTVIPAGLDAFFQKIGKPVETGTFLPPHVPSEEELHKLKTIAEKYGQKLYPPDYLG